jgi:flagellar capping protein FliD
VNVSDFVKANAASRYLGESTPAASAAKVGGAARGLEKAEQRIQALADTNTTQLSAVGKLKSSIYQAQLSSRALTGLTSGAKQFVADFNTAVTTALTAVSTANDPSLRRSANQSGTAVLRSLGTDGASLVPLKKAGFSMNADGKLALDSAKFDAAQTTGPATLRATLAKAGQKLDTASAAELSFGGNVGHSLAALGQRSSVLRLQQAAISALQKSATQPPAASFSGLYSSGIAAYQSN